jgi:Protein of unknown function (DUF3102)
MTFNSDRLMRESEKPAIVKNAASAEQIAWEIKAEHNAATQAVRKGLHHYKRIGELLLQAKATVPHGQWKAWVEKTAGVSHRSARRYMLLFTRWDQNDCEAKGSLSLNEAVMGLAGDDEEENGHRGHSEQQSNTKTDESTEAFTETPVTPKSTFCDRCQRTGPVKDCAKCLEIAKAAGRPPKGCLTKPRVPGDDSEAESHAAALEKAAPKNGAVTVTFDWEGERQDVQRMQNRLDKFYRENGRANADTKNLQGLLQTDPPYEGVRRNREEYLVSLANCVAALDANKPPRWASQPGRKTAHD